MMKRVLLLTAPALAFMVGCGSSEPAPVETAPGTAASVRKPEDIPSNLSPEARASAENELKRGQEMQGMANDPARVKAMQEMQKQKSGG